MKHFDIEQWADFSRGVASEADRSSMERHLASGCTRCNRIVHLLRGVAAVVGSEYEPPASVVRTAKALYQPPRPGRLAARIVYDSFRDPLPAGMRTSDRLTRHVLYEAGDYSLDVRVEEQPGGTAATLVGQLVKRECPAGPGEVQATLKTGTKTVARAAGNAFGEFQLDYRPVVSLQLEVSLGVAGPVLDVPLGQTSDPDAKPPRPPSRS
jgi:hypothetical protein